MGFKVRVDARLWTAVILSGLWKLASAPHNGKAVKSKQTLPIIDPCPMELFYCMARPILEKGRQVDIVKHNAGTKSEQVWRTIEETDLETIEAVCSFHNFNKVSGFHNARKSTRKSVTFYNVIIHLKFVHHFNARTDKHTAKISVVVASLNPSATTVFPPEFERSESNIGKLQRYLRGFPIRLKKDGYEVSSDLLSVCKEIANRNKRSRTQ